MRSTWLLSGVNLGLLFLSLVLPGCVSPEVDPLIREVHDVWHQGRPDEPVKRAGPRAVRPLIACLKDRDPHARNYAADRLGYLKDARAVKPLIACLKDEDQDVRSSAAQALGNLGDARAVEPLLVSLKEGGPNVRMLAAEALAKLGHPRGVEALIACLREPDPCVRSYTAAALGRLQDARAVEPLTVCLKDKDVPALRAAAEALDRFGWKPKNSEERAAYVVALERWDEAVQVGRPAIEPLMAYLEARYSFDVAHAGAAVALAKLGDARAFRPLVACLKDSNGAVRPRVAAILSTFPPKRIALVNPDRTLHPWNQSVPESDRVPSVGAADLLLIIEEQQETAMGTCEYRALGGGPAPSITGYAYHLPVELVEAKTGKELVLEQFASMPGPFPKTAPLSQTRIGRPVEFAQVFEWMEPILGGATSVRGKLTRAAPPKDEAQAGKGLEGRPAEAASGKQFDEAVVRAGRKKAQELGLNPVPAYVGKDGNTIVCSGTLITIEGGQFVLADNDMIYNVGDRPMRVVGLSLAKGEAAAIRRGQAQKLEGSLKGE